MEAKNLSISVPAGCPNKCPFCVAEQHENEYKNVIGGQPDERDIDDYCRRLNFAASQGVASVLLSGTGEPLMNMEFIELFAELNHRIQNPFEWIELQTSGVYLGDRYKTQPILEYLRTHVKVSTIALSVCDLFSSRNNANIMGIREEDYYDLGKLCEKIKGAGFNLRLSLNMSDIYNNIEQPQIFEMAECLGADQITFRNMFSIGDGGPEDIWIKEHRYSKWDELTGYICDKGTPLNRLSFGPMKYSINGMSTVADWDCMSTHGSDSATVRSLILRPNCKLYTHWGEKGSLIF